MESIFRELWIMFYDLDSGKELAGFTVEGMASDEIQETKRLLASENKIPESQIVIRKEVRTSLPAHPEVLADWIMRLSTTVVSNHNLKTGSELKQEPYKTEFIELIKKSISQGKLPNFMPYYVMDILADNNYHAEIDILLEKGFLEEFKGRTHIFSGWDE